MEKTLIWTPTGTTRLIANDVNTSHNLLVDPTAGNGQRYSFDAFDMIVAVVDNNAAYEEHGMIFTFPEVWRARSEWVGWADTSFMKLVRSSNSSFSRIAGDLALAELYGIQFVRHDHEHHD